MSDAQERRTATWWVCCYECEPDEAARKRGAPGLVLGFGYPDPEQINATELAVQWMGEHGDKTGHRELVMLGGAGLLPGEPMPRPRHGVVVFGNPAGEKTVTRGRALHLTPLDADGKPAGETVVIGQTGPVFVSWDTAPSQGKALPDNDKRDKGC